MFRSANSSRIFALAFFILLLMNGLSAQSWKVISQNDTLNYKRSSSTEPIPDIAVRVISEEISGSDTILNLNKFAYEIDNTIALINQPIFLQKNIIIKPNGLVVLSDTANYQLYPSAGIGVNWLFNPLSGVTAEVISIHAEDVLGIPDSVKTISLSDGNLIKISKKWGICSFPEFKNPGVNFLLTGIDNKRIGEFFPNHVDFARNIFVGDEFNLKAKNTSWDYHSGYTRYESTNYQFTIDSKIENDSSIVYHYSGMSFYDWNYEFFEYNLFNDSTIFKLKYTAYQPKDLSDEIYNSYPGEYFYSYGQYLVSHFSYDSGLHTIRKQIGGRTYNHISNDTLYNESDYGGYNYTTRYIGICGIPWMISYLRSGDYFYESTSSVDLIGWRKPWGSSGNFFDFGFDSDKWKLIGKTDTLNYSINNNSSLIPDESIWNTNNNNQKNDSIIQLNKTVVKSDDGHYLLKSTNFLGKNIQINPDKSLLITGNHEYRIIPEAARYSSWLFEPSQHISAFVESVYPGNVLGESDSIKTILLSNGKRIKLSKCWGLLSFPDPFDNEITYNLSGIQNKNIGKCIPDHKSFASSWEVGNLYRTREGRVENLSNGTVNEYITHKQFEVKEKSVTDSIVSYLVSGYRWEEMPLKPIRYYPYNDILEFSLEHAPFVGHEGLGKMQDKFDGDTLITLFNGNSYIHAVELYYDSLCQTTGKRIFGPPFQAIRNDTLIPVNPTATSLFDCRYDALSGLPTVLYSDKYYGSDLEESQTFFSEIVAWATPECSYGEFITNPLGIDDTDLPEDVIIYPNPFANTLYIDFQKDTGIHLIEIFNLSGIPVYTTSVVNSMNSLDLAHLSEGMYFVKITGKTGIVPIRIVKLK